MLEDPGSHQAERFRVLRASLEFANADVDAHTIAVTSAVDGEGKSTTVANLAVALARAGKRIVLLDADLRNPSLHRLFGLADTPGLVDVALGDVELGHALRQIELGDGGSNGAALVRPPGMLEVLPAGQPLHDPDRLGADAAVARIADTLRDHVDLVLIDTPPLLPVGDTIALSARIDALLLASRLKMLSSGAVERTRRILEVTPAAKLGFILTDTAAAETYSHYRYEAYEADRESVPVAAQPAGEASGNGIPAATGRRGLLRRSR
jgi:capsular exopolysaccharide synthesis family protein